MAHVSVMRMVQRAHSLNATQAQQSDTDEESLSPGHMILYDHYKPALPPGEYGIEAKQFITAKGQSIRVFNYNSLNPVQLPPGQEDQPTVLQKFTVVAPQFQLDPKLINSYYPPDGYVDEGRVLPHIVFNDPHLPWERTVDSRFFPDSSAVPPNNPVVTPWFALVVFDPEELKLETASGAALHIPGFNVASLPGSGAYPMTVGQYFSNVTSRVAYDSNTATRLRDSTESVKIIFPTKALVRDIFDTPNKFGYMSHVRKVDTQGLPDPDEEDKGLYSICVSHRSGPTAASFAGRTKAPQMQIVHLVSLEGLFARLGGLSSPVDPNNSSDRVGMVSLYSWSYLCAPPEPQNFTVMMTRLAKQRQPLRPPNPILDSILSSAGAGSAEHSSAARKLHDRLSQGYTITRWRTSAGDETSAFLRGPLVPVPTPQIPSTATDWPSCSNTGKDYQMLDIATGLMDVTYSAAFQLGKLLATSDSVFSQAMMRFRSTIHQRAISQAMLRANNILPAHIVLNEAAEVFQHVTTLTNAAHNPPMRNIIPLAADSEGAVTSIHSSRTRELLVESIENEFRALEAADDVLHLPGLVRAVSATPDFALITNWLTDKLLLSGIPAHYLVTDPSHLTSTPDIPPSDPIPSDKVTLQPEALRFFYIDPAWMDCMTDGALSVANHFDPVDDSIRREIKRSYNHYLRRIIPGTTIHPPIPRYGFILRSLIIKVMPDLKVTVSRRRPATATELPSPLVRLTRVNDQTILALLDCLPEDIETITISQPPHQQRYVAPIAAGPGVYYEPVQLFTSNAPSGQWPPVPDERIAGTADPDAWYNIWTRCLEIPLMVEQLGTILPDPAGNFRAPIRSSVVSLELNDKAYQLIIKPPEGSSPSSTDRPARQLWNGTRPDIRPVPIQPLQSRRDAGISAVMSPLLLRPLSLRPKSTTTQLQATLNPVLALIDMGSAPIVPGTIIVPPPPVDVGGALPLLRAGFIVTVHPSYRSAAPAPFSSTSPIARKVFSSLDYLPTQTTRLIDIVFSLRRNRNPTSELISSITVVIPTDDADPSTTSATEPLLRGPYNGAGAEMLYNRRLTPLLTSAPGQLQVRLVPRNAAPGEIKGLPNPSLFEATFVLRQCRIAPTKARVDVEIMGVGQGGMPGVVKRGLAKISIIEKSVRTGGPGESVRASDTIDVLKKDGEERDTMGAVV